MEYRRLGRSELQVSAPAAGCTAFGNRADAAESVRVPGAPVDAGTSLIETAAACGRGVSEGIVDAKLRQSAGVR